MNRDLGTCQIVPKSLIFMLPESQEKGKNTVLEELLKETKSPKFGERHEPTDFRS